MRHLSHKFIRDQLAYLYDEPLETIPTVASYEIRECIACGLQFSNPMLPGDNAFYEWIVKHHNYYPLQRWGWREIRDDAEQAANGAPQPLVVVDVGCGAGHFVAFMRNSKNLRPIGIDTTQSSINLCRAASNEAYCCRIEDARSKLPEGLDLATSFHCLEHVSDPVGFMIAMRGQLKPTGRIIVTTPYSPMSFELTWHDPLNHPPHHLTRWNESAYEALGRRIGMRTEIRLGPTVSPLRRSVRTLMLHAGQTPFTTKGKLAKIASLGRYCLEHPFLTAKVFITQFTRKRLDGKAAPDEIMVIFRNA